jgi:hypothetical protein
MTKLFVVAQLTTAAVKFLLFAKCIAAKKKPPRLVGAFNYYLVFEILRVKFIFTYFDMVTNTDTSYRAT